MDEDDGGRGHGHGPKISQARHLREQPNDSMFWTPVRCRFDPLSLQLEARLTVK
jgi:hypothetical protein